MEYINRFYWLIALCLIISTGANASVNPKPFVIPELKEWKGSDGTFVPTEATKIVYAANNPELERIARIFAQDYQTMFGLSLEVVQGKGAAGDFIFSLRADKKLGKEGYTIRVTDRVALSAPENIGVYWGTRTLLQIAEQSENHQLPKGTLRDYPDYPLRGFMIDCGRKFIPLSYLQDYVKTMSYYKMNTLQIHLNDNGFKQYFEHDWSKTYAAFRLECDTYPGLTARDGHYTKKEFVDLQKLAEQSYVEIIPEIDIPAHSLAFSHYKPELGSKEYGMDHLDLFNPEVYTFFDALFKEYLEGEEPVFRGNKVHVGTDEYSNAKKEVVEKFRAFTDHYIRYIESFGKQACVWGALTHAKGDTPVKSENVIMNAWYNGYADPKEMIKQGYHLISIPDGLVYIVPQAGYYYDYLNTKSLYEKWTPAQIGKAVFEEKDPNTLRGMFAPGLVYEYAAVTPNRTLPYREIGYNYLVSFDIKGADEAKGTELFRSPDAVFYLSDPISGMLGFARDGYLNTFNYRIMPGEHATVGISGDNRVTRLHINGKIVEELNIQKRFYNGGKDSMNYVRTLVFPLQETGNFKSQITNLKVYRQ